MNKPESMKSDAIPKNSPLLVTLNDHSVRSYHLRPDLVWPDTRKLLLPIMRAGKGNFPGAGREFRLKFAQDQSGIAVFRIFLKGEPVSVAGCARSEIIASGVEPMIEKLNLDEPNDLAFSFLAEHSPELLQYSWIATVSLPAFFKLPSKFATFVFDMNACIGSLALEAVREPVTSTCTSPV